MISLFDAQRRTQGMTEGLDPELMETLGQSKCERIRKLIPKIDECVRRNVQLGKMLHDANYRIFFREE